MDFMPGLKHESPMPCVTTIGYLVWWTRQTRREGGQKGGWKAIPLTGEFLIFCIELSLQFAFINNCVRARDEVDCSRDSRECGVECRGPSAVGAH